MERAAMWSPRDKNSLPNPSERILAIEAINSLQLAKEKLLEKVNRCRGQLAKAREEVNQVEQEIAKRTSWIAPVRRVPAEVLSLVFTECCKVEWKAPLALGAVCRRWRNTLIGTPQAWSFIEIKPTSRLFHHELISLWISRCGSFKLHISLHPNTRRGVVEAVCTSGKGIRCLSFFDNADQLACQFTQLEELRLGPETANVPSSPPPTTNPQESSGKQDVAAPCILSVERFPKLASLHLHSPSLDMMELIARKTSFPPLQTLHVHARGPHWLSIIRCCAESLFTLAIEYTDNIEDTGSIEDMDKPVTLPRLQDFHYVAPEDLEIDDLITLPTLRTPQLQSYHEINGFHTTPMHEDVSSITSLVLHQPCAVSWPAFPHVTHLRICDISEEFEGYFPDLENGELCPDLTVVECIPLLRPNRRCEQEVRSSFMKRSKLTGKLVDFRYLPSEQPPKGSGYSACYSFCRCELPMEDGQLDQYDEQSFYISRGYSEEDGEDDDSSSEYSY